MRVLIILLAAFLFVCLPLLAVFTRADGKYILAARPKLQHANIFKREL